MLINWVQEGPPVTKVHSCGLFHSNMPVTHGCWVCPWREMKKSKGVCGSQQVGGTEARAETESRGNFSSSKPFPASQSDDVLLSITPCMPWDLPGGWLALLKLASVHVSVLASPPARRQRCGPPTDGSSKRMHLMVGLSDQPERNSILYPVLWAEMLARQLTAPPIQLWEWLGSMWLLPLIARQLICWHQQQMSPGSTDVTATTQSPVSYRDIQACPSLGSNHLPFSITHIKAYLCHQTGEGDCANGSGFSNPNS